MHSDTVYSEPALEKRNKYARAHEEHAACSEQRRERLQPVGYSFNPSLMTHLSDLETSDSTRRSSRNPTIPDQHRTQSTIKQQHQQQRATTDYRLLHQVEHDRVNLELLQGTSAYENTGARPKQPTLQSLPVPLPPMIPPALRKIPLPPTIPTTVHMTPIL